MRQVKLLQYLFLEDKYIVGCRELSTDDTLPSIDSKKKYHFLMPTANYWYADPFLFEKSEKTYVFVEAYNLWLAKGEIGVTLFENGRFTPVKSILRKDFHMSYPNIFEWNSKIYMIPETCAIHQIQLYEAIDFPYKWSLKKVLVDNVNAVDTSVLKTEEGKLLLYSKENYRNGRALWFLLEKDLSIKPINISGVSQERPGGNPINTQNGVIRPLQDCQKCYGRRLVLYKWTADGKETLAQVIDADCISNRPNQKYSKTHTLNRSKNYEVIDAHGDFVDPLKILRKVFRKMKMVLTWSR